MSDRNDRATYRGVDHVAVSVLAGLLRVHQGEVINEAIRHYLGELVRTGRFDPKLAEKVLKPRCL